jgi:type II secretory pathway pseudopilin PulG
MKQSVFNTSGFSLPGVMVGVALLGITAVVTSNVVVESRRAQKVADIKLSSNKIQQAVLDAVTSRVKEFVLEDCSGARWSSTGTTEVDKAFASLPVSTASGGTMTLSLTRTGLNSGLNNVDCSGPVGPGVLNSGHYMKFCMEMNPPTGSDQIDRRLLELLIVPVDLATDEAITCENTRGPSAGIKVTWQMYSQVNLNKVRINPNNPNNNAQENKTVLKESGVYLISAETESYSGTCNVNADRVPSTNQCIITVQGMGMRPPTLSKRSGASAGFTPISNFSWTRPSATNPDTFTGTTECDTSVTHTFRAEAAGGTDSCDSPLVSGSLLCQSLTATRNACNPTSCTVKLTKAGSGAATANIPSASSITQSGNVYTATNVSCPSSGAVITGSLSDGGGGTVNCTPFNVPAVGASSNASLSGVLANTRWYASTGSRAGSAAPREIFAGQLSGATALRLTSASGVALQRVFPGFGACGESPVTCPNRWRVTFVNGAGGVISNGDLALNACFTVPPGTARAFVGFVEDGGYWDNEGCNGGSQCNWIQRRTCGGRTTGGCAFNFRLDR